MVDFNARCDLFRELITSPEILVMPGAHDALTARILELEGYKAVQHSSWGVAAAYGLPDGYMSFSESLDAARHMVRTVDIPVNADAEGGFGLPAIVYRSVSELIQIGAVGLNLEDKLANPGEKEWKIIELPLMLEKIDAFMEAKRDAKSTFVLNARTDAMMAFSGDPKRATQEAIRRGNAFAEKGADLIFVFGKYPAETIQVLVKEIQAPISVTCYSDHLTIPELQGLGVGRTSLGTDSVRVAAGAIQRFARVLRDQGTQASIDDFIPTPDLADILLQRQR